MGWTIVGSGWGGQHSRVRTNEEGSARAPDGVYLWKRNNGALQELGPPQGKLCKFGFFPGKIKSPPTQSRGGGSFEELAGGFKMDAKLELNGEELLEVDICDRGVCSEDESGVFVNSASSLQEEFSGFQQWASPPLSAHRDTSSPPGQQSHTGAGAPPGSAAPRARRGEDSDAESPADGLRAPRSSIVDCLLVELYETYSGGSRRNADSWDSSTEASGSDAFPGRSNSGSSFLQELQEKHTRRLQMNYLGQKGKCTSCKSVLFVCVFLKIYIKSRSFRTITNTKL